MYVRVLQDELKFPEDRVLDQDTKSLIRGVCSFLDLAKESWIDLSNFQLLQRNPALRMKQPRIKKHPYFSMMYVVSLSCANAYTHDLTEIGPMFSTNATYVNISFY